MFEVIIFGVLAGMATLIGMLVLFKERKLMKAEESYFFALAVGALIGAAFFIMIPKALDLSMNSIFYILAGFVGFYVLDNLMILNAYQEEEHAVKDIGLGGAIGYSFYHLFNGLIIALGFILDFKIGMIIAIAIVLFNIPDGIATITTFLSSKISKSKIINYSLCIILASPIGAIVGFYLIPNMNVNLGFLMSFAAGTFIYTAASDLAPDPYRRKGGMDVICFLVGMGIIFLLKSIM